MCCKRRYIEDITIAERTFREQLLNDAVKDCKLICDVYCVPSHNHQAFYFKLYGRKKEYVALYAKTLVVDFYGTVAMYGFENCINSEKNNASEGRIICGIKRFSENNLLIEELKGCLPTETEWVIQNVMLDGEHTVIRNHLTEDCKILSYHSGAEFSKNVYSEKQKMFLENLFLRIGGVIGNVLDC